MSNDKADNGDNQIIKKAIFDDNEQLTSQQVKSRQEDIELLSRYHFNKDDQAFRQFYYKYESSLKKYLLFISKDYKGHSDRESLIDDAAQEAFIKLHVKIKNEKKLEAHKNGEEFFYVKAFIYTVAKNKLMELFKKKANTEENRLNDDNEEESVASVQPVSITTPQDVNSDCNLILYRVMNAFRKPETDIKLNYLESEFIDLVMNKKKSIEEAAKLLSIALQSVQHYFTQLKRFNESRSLNREWQVYELVELQGFTYKEAAEELNISPETVKEYLKNARNRIKKIVKEELL